MSDLTTGKTLLFADYSKSGIQPKDEVNTLHKMVNNMRGKNGINVDATPLGITISGEIKKHYRFELVKSVDNDGDPIVQVYYGKWTRNGHITELETDVDKDYFTLDFDTFTQESDNFIYLELDDPTEPTEVTVTSAITIPDQTDIDPYWVLGNANLSDGKFLTLTQYWYGGDIDDVSSSSGNVDNDYECSLTQSLEADTCEEDASSSETITRHFNRIAGFLTPNTVANGTFGSGEQEYTVLTRKSGTALGLPALMRYWIPCDVEVVTDVTYSTTTHKLEMTKSTITVFQEVVSEENPILIEQAEECVAEE